MEGIPNRSTIITWPTNQASQEKRPTRQAGKKRPTSQEALLKILGSSNFRQACSSQRVAEAVSVFVHHIIMIIVISHLGIIRLTLQFSASNQLSSSIWPVDPIYIYNSTIMTITTTTSHLGTIQASGWHSSSQPLTRAGSAVGLGTRQGAPTKGPWKYKYMKKSKRVKLIKVSRQESQ